MRKLGFLLMMSCLALPVSAETPLAQGRWTEIDYEVEGGWRIVGQDGRLQVLLDDSFVTKDGPDLHVLLSPKPLDHLNNGNAADGALIVGKLVSRDDSLVFRKMSGAQQFTLPAGTRLDDYRSVLIHCVRFSHLWAGAQLPDASR